MIGGGPGIPPLSHTCEETQDVIDHFLQDIGEHDLFWVDIRYLNEEPFEYRPFVNVQKEIKEMETKRELLKAETKTITESLINLKEEKQTLVDEELKKLNEEKGKLLEEIANSEVIIKSRKEKCRFFTAEEIEEFKHNGDCIIEETKGVNEEWSRENELIVKKDGRYYEITYQEGLTEQQDDYYLDQTAIEVKLEEHENIVKTREWVSVND